MAPMGLCGVGRPRPRGDSTMVALAAHRLKPSCTDLTNMLVRAGVLDMAASLAANAARGAWMAAWCRRAEWPIRKHRATSTK
eukprot:6969758-Alexandrium_andersonii.AAC.1